MLVNLKRIWVFFYPVFLFTFVSVINHFIQQVIIANYRIESLPELALADRFLGIFTFISSFVSVATVALVGQFNGAKRYDVAGSVVWQMIWLSIFSLPIFCLIGLFVGPLIFAYFEDSILDYFRISLLFLPTLSIVLVLQSFFLCTGKAWLIWWSIGIEFCVSIPLTFLFLYSPLELGLKGIGLASGISYLIQMIFLIAFFLSSKNVPNVTQETENSKAAHLNLDSAHQGKLQKLPDESEIKSDESKQSRGGISAEKQDGATYKSHDMKLNFNLLKTCIKVGFPNAFGQLLIFSGWTCIFYFRMLYKNENLPGFVILSNFYTISFLFVYSFQVAMAVIISNLIGAKEWKSVQSTIFAGNLFSFCFVLIFSLLYLVFPDKLIFLFNYGSLEGNYEMRFGFFELWLTCCFLAIAAPFYATLRAAGDTKFIMFFTIFCSLILAILPVSILIFYGKASVSISWFLFALSTLIMGLGMFIRYKGNRWRVIAEKIQKVASK